MKRLVILASVACSVVSAAAVDITAVVREGRAATITRIQGKPYNDGGDYDVAALFDGTQGTGVKQRWIEKMKPTESAPVIIQYDIDEDFWPVGRPSEVVVKSFTLFNTWAAASSKSRAPAVFSLSASEDGTDWTVLYAVDKDTPISDWAENSTDTEHPRSHTFVIPLEKQGNYRHYLFTVTANNGDSDMSASELVLEGDFVPLTGPATDITAAVRAAGAATVTRKKGNAWSGGSFDVSALFDGSQGVQATERWMEDMKPTESSPIVIQYDIDENFWPGGRPSDIVVTSFTLYDTWGAADARKRAPTVFSLSASENGTDWTVLYAVDKNSPVTDWAEGASDMERPRSHTFGIPAKLQGSYRHYRFTVTANNGDSATSASELILEGDFKPYANGGSATSVFADAAYWFRGAADRNDDGVLQDGELSNALRLGLPNDKSHGCTVAGSAAAAQIVTATVDEPYAAASVERRVLALRPPMTQGEQDVKIQSGYVEVTGCSLPVTNVGPYSAVLRFSLDDMQGQTYKHIAAFGYGYSSKQGFLLTTYLNPGNGRYVLALMFGGGKNVEFRNAFREDGFALKTNMWVDVAFVIGGGKVTLYTCPAGGAMMVETQDLPTELGTGTAGYNLRLGAEEATAEPSSADSARRAMNGRFAQVAVWGRCLSEDEVRTAFGAPCPDLWNLGVPNGVSAEFAGGKSAAATIDSKDECAEMPPCLAAENPSVTLTFDVPSRQAGLAQVLRIRTASQTKAGRLSASLNGTALGEADYAPFETVSLFVRKSLIVSGANTLTLTRLDGGTLDIDALALGGSFRLGERNGDVWNEFLRTDARGFADAFDTYGGNVAEVVQQVFPEGHKAADGADTFSNVCFRVHVDPVVAALGLPYRFTARLRQTTLEGDLPVRLTLDGVPMTSVGLVKDVFTDCSFTVETIEPGDHLISCVNDCPSGTSDGFLADCYTFEIRSQPQGLMMIVR